MNEELAHDISMSLPDEVWCLNMVERYRRARHCSEFCTFDGDRYFIRGVMSVPFAYRDGDFTWGVWCEVSQADHDVFITAYETDTLGELKTLEGRLANEVPGYEMSIGEAVEIEVLPDARPMFVMKGDGDLAQEQRSGITLERHEELHEILFGDDEEDFEDEE